MAGITKLARASKMALKDYLGLAAEETLLVISDENKREIGLSLYEEGKKICLEAIYIEMKPREINGQEPPEPIADIMRQVDVVICPTTKSLTHTNARREATKLGVRVATMPGITLDIMSRCLNADFQQIIDLSNAVASKMKRTEEIHITTKIGTNVVMPVKNRKVIVSTGVLRNIGDYGNLPSGEVYLAPWERKTDGVVVFDGSIAGIGLLKEPVTVEIRNGYAIRITGGEDAEKLLSLLKSVGRDAFAVGEFGIGTNYKARLSGDILEDEKVLGTVHIAFGNNLSMGGKITVKSHLDGLITKPTVYFDRECIMDSGDLLIGTKFQESNKKFDE